MGDIEPEEFVKLDREKLVPTAILEAREQNREKHFQDSIVVRDNMPMLLKTHKGFMPVQ